MSFSVKTLQACLCLVGVCLFSEPAYPQVEPSVEFAERNESDLDLSILAPIRHNTIGILAEESDAYYRILRHAADANTSNQETMAREFLETRRSELSASRNIRTENVSTFVDLFENPERYTGRLVTFSGHVRKLIKYEAGDNEFGMTTLYEAWLYTEDSQSNPVVIVCSKIPEGMPLGTGSIDRVSTTGYFFKKYGYRAQDTTRVAPLILAKQLNWRPNESRLTDPIPQVILAGVAFATIAAIVWFVWYSGRKDRKFRERFHASSAEDIPGQPQE